MIKYEHMDNTYGRENLQKAELTILKELVDYFDKNGYHYVALGGTLLGAIRHKGFIPWDDDVDLGLPREEYDRFLQEGKDFFNGKDTTYELQAYTIDSSYLYYPAKLVNKSEIVTDKSTQIEHKTYAWVDIFPLDGMPENQKQQKIHAKKLLKARGFFSLARFSEIVNLRKPHRPWYEKLIIGFAKTFKIEKLFSKKRTWEKLDKLLHKYSYKDSEFAVNFMGAGKFKEMQPIEIYNERDKYTFEDIEIYSVKDYDTWLTKMYGDYMTPPKSDERNKHFTE